ncbi:epimerase, partial [Streptomyces sp. SID7804]|nr:epimerase [Streptomyces sp. SID7804]
VERAFGLRPTPLEDTLDATVTWYEQWLSRP